ncbi:helix-turn-helix domain-containing protein [Sphingobium scionense]|uniref:helix-turn-helix domain-containing protein n=2 Tax=Sphingomonadaceae TaxID=41297 RepID=UPI0035E9AE9C
MAACGNVGASLMLGAQPVRARTGATATPRRQLGESRAETTSRRPVLAPWQVSLAMRTMCGSLGGAISISDVATRCRLSLCYFVRAFTNTVGISPYAWFANQRILCAKRLLASSALPLAQVALECGFSDQAHFTNAFAKAAGMTPARWRRKMHAS